MFGDRKYDIIGAKKIRIESVGFLYGYGILEELKKWEQIILQKMFVN